MMNADDFNKWLNEDTPESEKRTEDIMSDLKEYRLKTQLKQRLQAKRRQRTLIKRGLIGLVVLLFLLSFVYLFWQKQKHDVERNTPTGTIGFENKPIEIQKTMPPDSSLNDSMLTKPKLPQTVLKDSVLPNKLVVTPSQEIIEKQSTINITPPIKSVERPPVDTEYLYVTPSSSRPVYFYTETANIKDTFTVLDLSKEKLTTIPEKVFPYTQLKILLLNRNLLKFLPKEMGKLTHLEQLDVSRNKLTALPIELTMLSDLISLNLEDNKIFALPLDLGNLSKLKTLNVSTNKLTQLPNSIGQLSQLTFLDFGDNMLKALPDEIGQLTALKTLGLSSNNLKTLPKSIGNLRNLTALNANSNAIKELPDEIGNLDSLTTLDLGHNNMWKLPTNMSKLTNLTTLDLSFNHLTRLPSEFKKFKKLTYLDLRDNHFDYDEIQIIKRWLPNCHIEF